MSREYPVICVGEKPVTLEQVVALGRGQARVQLDSSKDYRARLDKSIQLLRTRVEDGGRVYGVTTGVGDSCETDVDKSEMHALPVNLVRFHGCGTGRLLSEDEALAVVAVRLASIARGYSGVRRVVMERLCDLVNHRVAPCIPEEGSVGASGDLTPLSYVAAVLMGEREVFHNGALRQAKEALAALGGEPLLLLPKESLALMNGTSVMAGLACMAYVRASRFARFSSALTAMATDVLQAPAGHFDERIFALKPHPGQATCARWIREDIDYVRERNASSRRFQERYSIRCAPHVIGVLLDAMPLFRSLIETEVNSVNDNPIVDPDADEIWHGGNFYGGHVAFAMDSMKNAVANIADLLDRQLVLLCNPMTNRGLPTNLSGATDEANVHHGFKAMQISTSALTAEALKLTMPASVLSRSTENHNQDKVSMGTIATRDCLRVLELVETVAAIALLACCQAVDLRERQGCHSRSLAMWEAVRKKVPMHRSDRRMDHDIRDVLELYRSEVLPIGEME